MQNNEIDFKVSVIVPCYNYGKFLKFCLESVQKQTYSNWECLIVDDGSTDNTKEISENFCLTDPRFKYIYQSNSGLSSARNLGIKISEGEFIQFLDADDYLSNNKFSSQLELIGCMPFNCISYTGYSINNYATIKRDDKNEFNYNLDRCQLNNFISDWEIKFTIPIHCFLFRKAHIINVNGFDESLPTHEDLDLYLKMCLNNIYFYYLPIIGAFYTIHGDNMTRDNTKMISGYLQVLEKFTNTFDSYGHKFISIQRFSRELFRAIYLKMKGEDLNLSKLTKNIKIKTLVLAIMVSPLLINYVGMKLKDKFTFNSGSNKSTV